MTDLAALGLTVTSDGVVKATGSLNEFKRASDVAAAGANRVEVQAAELSGAMRKLDATASQTAVSMQRLDNAAMGGTGGLQNIGFQVQDFAVQVAAGTSASQALAQQLPQLLSGFGLLGIGLGTAAAVIIPLAGYFMGAAKSAQQFYEAIDELDTRVSDLNEALSSVVPENYDDLIERYTVLNQSVLDNIANIAALNAQLIGLSQLNVEGVFSEAFGGILTNRIDEMRIAFETTNDQARGLLALMENVGQARGPNELISTLTILRDELIATAGGIDNMTTEQAAFVLEISRAIDQANVARGALEGMEAAARDAAAAITPMPQILQRAASAASNAASAVAGIGSAAAGAIGQIQSMAVALWDAAAATTARINAEQRLSEMAFEFSPAGQAMEQYGSRGTTDSRPVSFGDGTPAIAPVVMGGGGGGGGGSAIEEYTEAQKRALKVIGEVNEASVTQAEVIAALEEMYASGAITSDQLATAIGNVKDEFSDLEKVSFSLSEGLAGVFTDALTGAKSLQDGLKDLLKSMADLFLNAAFKSFLGGIFPSIDFGGFRAGGGGVTAGRSYIVGERGPELFTPGRSGGITPNSAMKGGGTMVQINNYSGAPVREQRSTGPDGRELVKVIVGEELGSGGYDKQLGRYGATPARVKR